MGSGFEGFDFSHEGMMWVVGFFYGFVFAIASAPCDFLYLINEYMIYKKRKKKKGKKKKEKNPLFPSSISSATPPAIDISTP